MGINIIDTKVIHLFEDAVMGKTDKDKAAAARELRYENPGVADLAEVLTQARAGSKDPGYTHSTIREKYQPLFELADEWSSKKTEHATAKDIEFAVNSVRQGGGKEEIKLALAGVTNIRTTLIVESSNAFNSMNDPARLDQQLSNIRKMDPDLEHRLRDVIATSATNHDAKPVVDVITDISHGKYDKYGLSKAAYDFNQLSAMDPTQPEYKPAFDQAVSDNRIIGPYLAELKKVQISLSRDGSLDAADESALGMLKKGFSVMIREGKEVSNTNTHKLETEAALQPSM